MTAPNTMMQPDNYVPLLKCKQGELGALSWLRPADRDRLVPLVEVLGNAKQATALASAWPDRTNVIFVHPLNIDDIDDAGWETTVSDFFDRLRQVAVPFVPVVTMDDSAGLLAVVSATCARDGRGAVIRLDGEATALASSASLAAELTNLLSGIGLSSAECDLILDLGLVRDSVVARVTTAEAALRSVPRTATWRNVILAFSAFPDSVGLLVPASTIGRLPRDDAVAFTVLSRRGPAREPIFADYAIGTPLYVNIPWAPIPAVRYTSGQHWFIHRGATKVNRSAQYVSLATDLVASPHFAGAGSSRGDLYFSDVAAGVDGPGNPTTYVRAGTARHLVCVLERLSTLGEP
jgi:hypothetical protein